MSGYCGNDREVFAPKIASSFATVTSDSFSPSWALQGQSVGRAIWWVSSLITANHAQYAYVENGLIVPAANNFHFNSAIGYSLRCIFP